MKRHCCYPGCGKRAEFEIYDSNDRRPDQGTEACEDHLGHLVGGVPPVEPVGPWLVYPIDHGLGDREKGESNEGNDRGEVGG